MLQLMLMQLNICQPLPKKPKMGGVFEASLHPAKEKENEDASTRRGKTWSDVAAAAYDVAVVVEERFGRA